MNEIVIDDISNLNSTDSDWLFQLPKSETDRLLTDHYFSIDRFELTFYTKNVKCLYDIRFSFTDETNNSHLLRFEVFKMRPSRSKSEFPSLGDCFFVRAWLNPRVQCGKYIDHAYYYNTFYKIEKELIKKYDLRRIRIASLEVCFDFSTDLLLSDKTNQNTANLLLNNLLFVINPDLEDNMFFELLT